MILGIAQCLENKNIESVRFRPVPNGTPVIDFYFKEGFAGNQYINFADYTIREDKYITKARLEFIYE